MYGLVFFLPHQVAVLTGRPIGLSVGIYAALPWLAALVAALAVPAGVARIGRVGLVAAATLTGAAAGLAVSALASTPSVALAGLCLAAAGSIAVQPLFWAIATARLGGAAAAGGIALVNAVGAAASFAAPNLRVWTDTAAGYDGAGLLAIAALALAGAAGLAALDRRPG